MDDDPRRENYMCLNIHIELLENYPLTEDRLEAYKSFYRMIREHFPDMRNVNPECQDSQVRRAATMGDAYMKMLDNEFTPEVYLYLLKLIRIIVDRLTADEELDGMMSMLSM
jgi:hypothetical protein